jgi:hypothetical protein
MPVIDLNDEEIRERIGELALVVKEPAEIWQFWDVERKGLFRIYLLRVADRKTHPYFVFRTEKEGWVGDEAGFATEEDILKKRLGTLVYRRPD